MTAGKVKVLLVVSGLDMDKSADWLVNMYINIKESDIGRRDGPDKLDCIVTVQVLKVICVYLYRNITI